MRLLGRRVSLRYRLPGDLSHAFSEAVGALMSVDPEAGKIVVATRRGDEREVPITDITDAKVWVPDEVSGDAEESEPPAVS